LKLFLQIEILGVLNTAFLIINNNKYLDNKKLFLFNKILLIPFERIKNGKHVPKKS
jgi:hypothetical protein